MEVLVGPTFGVKVASSAATFGRDRPQEKISSSSCLFLKEDDDVVGGADDPTGDGSGSDPGSPELSSDSSSSIGVPDDSTDEEEDEDGVVSSGPSLGLASLSSIEDSLPIKRGLSNHYTGKSKSFASLSDISSSVSSVKDLQKPENPFNKRRRICK
ncbi:hypothetical protein CCACVL1_09779 [Corchorus capsularis]|uniref:Uncharacterized protein n=1 Tax=Corchorus capsularis TaxID=210143 RepID=A0A1R3IU68_COCAP|nr:hypothetical protein CCACVL1_09779 [Corchorus capsularis]